VNLKKEAEFLPKSCQPHGEVVDWEPVWEELEKEEAAKGGGYPRILELALEDFRTEKNRTTHIIF
jgi:hypothetical protein